MARGGKRAGAGRKKLSITTAFKKKLSKHEDEAIKQLGLQIQKGNMLAIKLLFEYLHGKPRDLEPEKDIEEQGVEISTPKPLP